MNFGKTKTLLLFFIILTISFQVKSQTLDKVEEDKPLDLGIDILKRYFYEENNWYITLHAILIVCEIATYTWRYFSNWTHQ